MAGWFILSGSWENKQDVGKNISFRLLKNGQMQGPRGAFHLPVRQAILCRERF